MAEEEKVKNIVLFHGAFADGSSWSKVIPLLQEMSYHAIAVQKPMTSFGRRSGLHEKNHRDAGWSNDSGGHSWGGTVVTQAGDDPKVAALVYVAAYAPEVGQSANDASSPFGRTEGQKQIRVDSNKFATVTSKGMLEDIAQGFHGGTETHACGTRPELRSFVRRKVNRCGVEDEALMVYCLGKRSDASGCHGRIGCKEMGAVTTTLPTCHMVILEAASKVAAVIDEAAKSALAKS
jgi:pimeloyl-ACP methyl ester carboxylesterase